MLLYIGGGQGGPTGTVRFHRELELNWSPVEQVAVPNWPGLSDRLVACRRNPVRRPLAGRDRCPGCRRFMPTGSAGRCDACFTRHPPAMALLVNGYRVEYPREVVDAMPPGLRLAFARSPSLITAPANKAKDPACWGSPDPSCYLMVTAEEAGEGNGRKPAGSRSATKT